MRRLFLKTIIQLRHDDRGANLVEYGFLAMLIAVAALLSIEFIGTGTTSNVEGVIPALGK